MNRGCKFEGGCDGEHYGRGWCRAHLWQLNNGVPLRPVRRRGTTPACTFPECGKPHKGLGYCSGHLNQLHAGVELHPLGERRPRQGGNTPTAKPKRAAKGTVLPPGWNKTAPARKPAPAKPHEMFVVAPVVAPVTLAACLIGLRDHGNDDLADMLGVSPDQIRDAAERWELFSGKTA